MKSRKIYVFIELSSENTPRNHIIGQLWAHFRNGRETASFEYSDEWLEKPERFSLEPSLFLSKGVQHTEKKIFGSLGDSAPDTWGRILMKRYEYLKAKEENRRPRTLNEIDYLLLVNDEARQGALRFKEDLNGEYLSSSSVHSIPPFVNLPELLSASEHITENKETQNDLQLLLAPGSSLGGARPKASVIDKDGNLCIAKFPKKDDNNSNVLWEAVALTLAKEAGITVPVWQLENVKDKAVLILRRFDRRKKLRIPFISAMSILNAIDNDPITHSYMDIADALKQYGARPKEDSAELWRRIIFSVLISNTDDHLRNHGFLYEGEKGWRLSPVYDINPNADNAGVLSTYISQVSNLASVELALSVCNYFNLKQQEAANIVKEVQAAVSVWEKVAKQFGISQTEINLMQSAFKS